MVEESNNPVQRRETMHRLHRTNRTAAAGTSTMAIIAIKGGIMAALSAGITASHLCASGITKPRCSIITTDAIHSQHRLTMLTEPHNEGSGITGMPLHPHRGPFGKNGTRRLWRRLVIARQLRFLANLSFFVLVRSVFCSRHVDSNLPTQKVAFDVPLQRAQLEAVGSVTAV